MRNALTKALALALLLGPAVAHAEEPQKIAYVDLQRALNEVDEGKAATALLKRDFDEKQKQVNAKKAEFDKAQADFEKQAVVLTDKAKQERGAELEKRARELQTLFVQLQKEFSDRERQATSGIFDKMSGIVREIAEKEGYAFVLERNSGIVYAPPSLDLTNELIRKYNARYPAKAEGAAPAAPKAAPAQKPATAPKKK